MTLDTSSLVNSSAKRVSSAIFCVEKRFSAHPMTRCGRRGGTAVGVSDLGSEGQEFEPWLVHPRCVLRQDT